MIRILILGAGISGLSLGWYLKKEFKDAIDLTIVEKSEQAGGLVKTAKREEFLFDAGPKSLRTTNSKVLFDLIQDLKLEDQIISPSFYANNRFIYRDKKMEKVPNGVFSFLFSTYGKAAFQYILKDFFGFSKSEFSDSGFEDESIKSFMERKFGPEITENLFASLVSGIYAGDIEELSLKSCFPLFHQLEQKYGSLTRGMLLKKKETKKNELPPIISFKNGMQTLTDALFTHLKEHVILCKKAGRAEILKNGATVSFSDGTFLETDLLFSCLPAHDLATILDSPVIKSLLLPFHSTSIASISLGFQKPVLNAEGFGYLIPPKEKENILGAVFDSSIFSDQNKDKNKTRLTVMVGGAHFKNFDSYNKTKFLDLSLKAIADHLNIKEKPSAFHVEIAKKAIAQYKIGHEIRVKKLLNQLPFHVKVLGASFSGVSVNDCITNSHLAASLLSDCKKNRF